MALYFINTNALLQTVFGDFAHWDPEEKLKLTIVKNNVYNNNLTPSNFLNKTPYKPLINILTDRMLPIYRLETRNNCIEKKLEN